MSFTFECPSCGKPLEAQEEWRGRDTVCPGCQAKIVIPVLEPPKSKLRLKREETNETYPQEGPSRIEVFCPQCGTRNVVDKSQIGSKITCDGCAEGFIAQESAEKLCPFCGKSINAKAKICKYCKKVVSAETGNSATPAQTNNTYPAVVGQTTIPSQNSVSGIQVSPLGRGKFSVIGRYSDIWACVCQVLQECECNIRDSSPVVGKIIAKSKFGINFFGMTVTVIFYVNGNSTVVEFVANLTDAFDTMGACSRKVNVISERFMGLASTFVAPPSVPTFPAMAPSFAQRAGESYAGQARTSFFLGLGGLLLVPLGVFGIVMGAKALHGMSRSRNDEGKGFAIAGIVTGGVSCFFGLIWLLILISD